MNPTPEPISRESHHPASTAVRKSETLRTAEAAGGKVTQPKMAVPGIGWAAFVTDPEGNLQGVFQDDQNAA